MNEEMQKKMDEMMARMAEAGGSQSSAVAIARGPNSVAVAKASTGQSVKAEAGPGEVVVKEGKQESDDTV